MLNNPLCSLLCTSIGYRISRLKFGRRVRYYSSHFMTNIIHLDADDWSSVVQKACDILHGNGVIAVPTDTIYGIAALAQSSVAIDRVYAIKGRDLLKPIAISLAAVCDVYRFGKVTISDTLLHQLLPGPVTVVFERTLALNPRLNPGTSLVGIRVPDSGFVCDVARQCGQPLALTSANISDHPSSVCVQEFADLWPKLDAVFDGGVLGMSELSKKGSTVVDLSKKGFYTIIRDGSARNMTVSVLQRHGLKEELKL